MLFDCWPSYRRSGAEGEESASVTPVEQKPVAAETVLADSEGSVRILHWNVFEDGLTETPGNLCFHGDFEASFSALLKSLCLDAQGKPFWGFAKARDYSKLPPTKRIESCKAFFGFVDVVYSVLYHKLGGEARFGDMAPGDPPDLHNTLRTIFLESTLDDVSKPPSADNRWSVPHFERELTKICAPDNTARRIRDLREQVFDSLHGFLSWEKARVDGVLWKRGANIWEDWCEDLDTLREPSETDLKAEGANVALEHLLKVTDSSAGIEDFPSALITVAVDGNEIVCVRSLSMQASVRWLLLRLCEHSLATEEAAQAICKFAGVAKAPDTSEERAELIFPTVLKAIGTWHSEASLTARHTKFCRKVEQVGPHIVTVVEFDEQWRKQAAPAKRYEKITGHGTAAILFKSDCFERITELDGVEIPSSISQLDDEEFEQFRHTQTMIGTPSRSTNIMSSTPKSSSMALLKQREGSTLFLVVAAHLESAPPSDTRKVMQRQLQIRSVLEQLSTTAQELTAAGHSCAVVVGGDFNALAEEFVLGTTDQFWEAPRVKAVRPELRRVGNDGVFPPDPPVARFGEDGALHLICPGLDSGELRQRSHGSHHEGVCSTRAGSSMVIDFIFVGYAGGLAKATEPLAIFTPQESGEIADQGTGIYHSVMVWGSDHLPVGCVMRDPPTCI